MNKKNPADATGPDRTRVETRVATPDRTRAPPRRTRADRHAPRSAVSRAALPPRGRRAAPVAVRASPSRLPSRSIVPPPPDPLSSVRLASRARLACRRPLVASRPQRLAAPESIRNLSRTCPELVPDHGLDLPSIRTIILRKSITWTPPSPSALEATDDTAAAIASSVVFEAARYTTLQK